MLEFSTSNGSDDNEWLKIIFAKYLSYSWELVYVDSVGEVLCNIPHKYIKIILPFQISGFVHARWLGDAYMPVFNMQQFFSELTSDLSSTVNIFFPKNLR